MICIKDYRRHGNTYIAGQEYELDAAVAAEHEAYFGCALWEGKGKAAKVAAPVPAAEAPKPKAKGRPRGKR